MQANPRNPLTWPPSAKALATQLKEWTGRVPPILFHGTADGGFTSFDLDVSHGCVWFTPARESAEGIARDKLKEGHRGRIAAVYECSVTFRRIAAFRNEDGIYEFGGTLHRSSDRGALRCAAHMLRALGYDGIVEFGYWRTCSIANASFGALELSTISILSEERL